MKIVTISAMEARRKFGEILNRVYLKNEEIIFLIQGTSTYSPWILQSPTKL